MRALLALVLASSPITSMGSPVLDLHCREAQVRQIDPSTLQVREYEGSTRYRFRDGKLFLATSNRPEYLYGSLREPEPGRFIVGHKTIYFVHSRSGQREAQISHVYKDEVRISRAVCE